MRFVCFLLFALLAAGCGKNGAPTATDGQAGNGEQPGDGVPTEPPERTTSPLLTAPGGNPSATTCVAISPDGRLAVTGNSRGGLSLWDLDRFEDVTDGGRTIRGFGTHINSHNEPQPVQAVAFSTDGKFIVSGAIRDPLIRVWEVQTGKQIRPFKASVGSVEALAFSGDGKCLVCVGEGATLKVLDFASGLELRSMKLSDQTWLDRVAFSPSGRYALACSENGPMELWDTALAQVVRKLEGHTWGVWSAAFSPDEKRVISAGSDHALKVWDVKSGKALWSVSWKTGEVYAAAFLPGGKEVVSVAQDGIPKPLPEEENGVPAVRDAATGKLLRSFPVRCGGTRRIVATPDGKRVLFSTSVEQILCNVDTGREVWRFRQR